MKNFLMGMLLCLVHQLYGCGIVCYIGSDLCKAYIQDGLSLLEYRGYDSAGIAYLDSISGELTCVKSTGTLDKLKEKLSAVVSDGHVGIGHTRWATHGPANDINAHPHVDCCSKTAIVHNGIIENYAGIKESLLANGHCFQSDTDSEILAHYFRCQLNVHGNIQQAACETLQAVKGSCATVILMQDHPETLVAIRKGAPLCIGVAEGEKYIASDFLAFASKTRDIVFIPENAFALVNRDDIALYDAQGNQVPVTSTRINLESSSYQKLGYEHYMLKEIYEQPRVIRNAVSYYRTLHESLCEQLGITAQQLKDLKSINLFACGTSWHAACIGKFFFEECCAIPVHVHIASEYRYMPFLPEENSLYIAISQSGETADTLECMRMIKEHGFPVVTLTNVGTSTMVRESDGYLLLQAGPEIAVASTKAFTAQIAALYWLAHYCAYQKGLAVRDALNHAEKDLDYVAQVMEQVIEKYRLPIIEKYAKYYAPKQKYMFLGRHSMYPFALEAALKLKEISYIFAQGFAAGELKHGSIALVDSDMPVMLFSHLDPVIYKKLVSNAQEVKARKGHIIVVAFEGQRELLQLADAAFILPPVAPMLAPLAMTNLMQFFVYQIAKELGRDIDKPRNLAKAVTVE